MTPEEKVRVREELVEMLLETQRFDSRDVANRYAIHEVKDAREVALLLWEAREIVRTNHGIVFGKVPRLGYLFDRLTPEGIAKQARRQRQGGKRKIVRAVEKTELAATRTEDERDKERLEKEAQRQRLKIAMAKRNRWD